MTFSIHMQINKKDKVLFEAELVSPAGRCLCYNYGIVSSHIIYTKY